MYLGVLEALLPAAWHRTDQHAGNRVEVGHGRLKARLRPMRGLKQDCSARIIIAGHAFVQDIRRGHYELAVEESANRRLAVAFDERAGSSLDGLTELASEAACAERVYMKVRT